MIQSNTIVIILHGLEGNADKEYIKGLARTMNKAGRDAVALNFRGCSNEDNRKFYSYHSGKTEDLETVIKYITSNYKYDNLGYGVSSPMWDYVFKTTYPEKDSSVEIHKT